MENKIYIEFEHPKGSSFPESNKFQKLIENTLDKILTAILPNGNPDFDHLIEEVKFWRVEYDVNENTTWREIGLDKNRKPIVAMPLAENYGFWTDNNLELDDYKNFDPQPIDSAEFQLDWNNFKAKMKK
ncbi:hypothetical protein [Winogradskyella ouciana]|uniref:hypothetical protein n=1 Tax=Winogradskyella ouciana TaxID=2608631 RepID=UPI003D282F69